MEVGQAEIPTDISQTECEADEAELSGFPVRNNSTRKLEALTAIKSEKLNEA